MSKRYQVLREMPFCKVGDILDYQDNGYCNSPILNGTIFVSWNPNIDKLIQEGWIKPVEEEKKLILSIRQPTGKNISQEIYTEEIDEKELAKIQARAKIKRFIEENGLKEGNIYPVYDEKEKSFEPYTYYSHFVNEDRYGFSTFEHCKKLISSCSDELKIVFGIE